jgi:hypothetical protein
MLYLHYQEICDLLVAAGYFRARIKGLSPFDKVFHPYLVTYLGLFLSSKGHSKKRLTLTLSLTALLMLLISL